MAMFINRLPAEYQEVEYIESDGTQYIDTGITSITKEFAIEINFSITTSKEYQTLWCCRTHNVDVTRTCFTTALTGFRNDQGTQTSVSKSLSLNQKYNLKSTKTQFILDNNILLDNIATTNNAINDKVWLLSSYAVGTSTPSNQFDGKLYGCKIWDNGELIRHYIPCYRKSDDVIGLYDITNNIFYVNAGTGTFTKGNNVDNVKAISFSKLPTTYQEVEYLESSGTQYISTGITPTSKTGINLDYSYNTISSSTPAGISGVYQPSSPRTDTLFVTTNSGKTNSTIMLISRGKSIDAGIVPTANTKYNAKINWLNDGNINFNNGQVESTNGTNNVVSRETILFGRYYNGSNAYTSARIYKCQFSEDENIIRDYIPCYRKNDFEPGLYDIVNNVFYTNQGTGTFTVGKEVKEVKQLEDINGNIWWKKSRELPSEYTQVAYIENTGQSYINTNLILNQNSKVELTVYSTDFTQGHLFGSRESATSKNFTISDGHLDFGSYTSNRITFNTHADGLKTKLTMDKNTFTVDNETYNDTYNLATVNYFTCIAPAYIFYVSGNPYGNYRVWGKLYGCKIWKNGILARELIPCYRNSNNEAGLYDLVKNVFYTNAGTGSFSYGFDNLFDPTTAVIMESYFQTGQNSIASSSANRMTYIECKPNTTYEISKLQSKIFWVGYTTQLPANGVAVSGITQGTQDTFDGTTRTSLNYTTGSNATYLVFRYTQIYMDGSANADTIKNSIEIYEK